MDDKKVSKQEIAWFYSPEKKNPTNKGNNLNDVICNVMAHLTLCVIVKTDYSFKRPYFHE